MSEYWKSTPKYWCKYCSMYVRDTKLERTNHDNTSKHQYGLKRFLRDLHRGHENEEREKERAKREVDRLNGIVNPSVSAASASSSSSTPATTTSTVAQRQQQWEQLAEMGIDVPTDLRKDMALAGEWTVTNTRIIDHTPVAETENNGDQVTSRKRPKPEAADDEKDLEEEDKHVQGLFKKPRKWGRDTKLAVENDAELDALLSTPLVKPAKKEEEEPEQSSVKEEMLSESLIKKEDTDSTELLSSIAPQHPKANEHNDDDEEKATVKRENDEDQNKGTEAPAVVFKKRKPKNIRQK